MPLAERTAVAHWKGDLLHGTGDVSFKTGAVSALPVSWTSRVEDPAGNTSPEELLAAAQAVCYAMSLSNVLARGGHTPNNLDVTATCTFDRVDGNATITEMALSVRGAVEGVDALDFQAAADEAEQACPVANAIRGNVEITLEADLEGPPA